MRLILVALACLVMGCAAAQSVSAEGAAASSPHATIAGCLSQAGGDRDARRSCIGVAARACSQASPGSETTGGAVQCIEVERRQWEDIRNAEAEVLRARESEAQRALLDAALAEHVAWVRALCAYEASIYERGSLGRVVAITCMRDEMAEHALLLLARYDEL
jgi:hypothetical protein